MAILQYYAAGLAGVGFALCFGSSSTAAAGAFVGAGLFGIAYAITLLKPAK